LIELHSAPFEMGTYLSTPVTEKISHQGECLDCEEVPARWAVVDMQGWRKSMEDAHVVDTDLKSEMIRNAKIFGVFDGHGGPEVARFCQLYMVSVLKQQTQLWSVSSENATEEIGPALVKTFHALDRMIDDPARREELIRLRTVKTNSSERRDAGKIPDSVGVGMQGMAVSNSTLSPAVSESAQMQLETNLPTSTPVQSANDNERIAPEIEEETDENVNNTSNSENKNESNNDCDQDKTDEDDDSNEAAGKESAAAERDQGFPLDGETSDSNGIDVMINPHNKDGSSSNNPGGKVSFMFQRLLSMSSPSGQMVAKVGDGAEEMKPDTEGKNLAESAATNSASMGPSALRPTIVQNGRLICNLPDHPIHAGCTAVVALLVGKTLTVANAGDSRAVLCRKGGETEPLSFDHKPQQATEMNRIKNAGGFVNQFGRVNGNLNLSRSIGDLKYKQVPHISPAEQMITAEPDILQVTLHEGDEFLILGCDGIWDCLTNEKAVQYVRERIDTKEPREIGEEMLDDIISDDPKATQGIGGDNMTIMIVDLLPASRSYNRKRNPDVNNNIGEILP